LTNENGIFAFLSFYKKLNEQFTTIVLMIMLDSKQTYTTKNAPGIALRRFNRKF